MVQEVQLRTSEKISQMLIIFDNHFLLAHDPGYIYIYLPSIPTTILWTLQPQSWFKTLQPVAPQMLRRAKVILPLASAVAWLPPLPRRDPVTAGRPTATQGRVRTPIRCEVTTSDQRLVEDMLHFGVVDREVRAMALKKVEERKQSQRTWLGFGAKIAGLAGVGIAAAYAPYLVLGKLGFGATGIAAGSMAASSQGAAIGAGTWFAWAQSTAATGAGFWKLGVASSVGTYIGANQQKCEREEWTDEHVLMTLVVYGLDDEMRNLMRRKLQMRSRLYG